MFKDFGMAGFHGSSLFRVRVQVQVLGLQPSPSKRSVEDEYDSALHFSSLLRWSSSLPPYKHS